jgi:hypothetical protein
VGDVVRQTGATEDDLRTGVDEGGNPLSRLLAQSVARKWRRNGAAQALYHGW